MENGLIGMQEDLSFQMHHNILSVAEPPSLKRRGFNGKFYEYTYISTSGINKTIFWKLSNEFLATGGKQCI